jgi:hypothetical protein
VKPSDDAIVLAFFLRCYPAYGSGEGWLIADEVRGALGALGFRPSVQMIAGALGRLCREDLPMIERQKASWETYWSYRVTRYGRTQLANHFPRLRVTNA